MYVILGGAYNGKRAYVEQLIAQMPLKELVVCEGVLPNATVASPDKRFIISEFEKIVLPLLDQPEEQVAQQIFEQIKRVTQQCEVFCICTDMSRGVVPIEKQERVRILCRRSASLIIRTRISEPTAMRSRRRLSLVLGK